MRKYKGKKRGANSGLLNLANGVSYVI